MQKRKSKLYIPAAILLCILAACSLFSCTQSTPYEERTTILVYIHSLDSTGMTFDQIEWVNDPSERATELGIPPSSTPNGYYIHNEAEETETLPFAENCLVHILDWHNGYVSLDLNLEEFILTMAERTKSDGTIIPIPYHVTIEKGEIIDIQEQYIP